ncbi:phosphoribosyltransferase [Hoeflea ulvae]|uniref:phosphoribosyltransferase n=1 Tax=Hoeflea ulvae TaxID=2983764 RepID=UPI002D1E36FC|nr:phosphoribosyltransferase family protein [Hoeflea ulvae]
MRNEDVICHARVSDTRFAAEARRECAEIERRRKIYSASRPALAIAGRTVIVVDDGIATGATLRAALKGLQAMKPQRIVVAVPVAPAGIADELQSGVDEVIVLEPLGDRGAVSLHYQHFPQLADSDVIAALDAASGLH